MKKLAFLAGKWVGEARVHRAQGDPLVLAQTEEAEFKLDGQILVIEGRGRAGDQPLLQALGVVSYDDEAREYRMRAFNDGRFLETEVKLLESGKGFRWSFASGQIKSTSALRITEDGDWTELTEIAIGAQPPRKYMELKVSRQK